jgi:hypothetical protein
VPLPLLPAVLIGLGVVGGTGGVAFGLKGGHDIKKANARIKRAGERYVQVRSTLEAHVALTNAALEDLGVRQHEALQAVVLPMADFLRRHQKQVSESDKLLADGLEATPGSIELDMGLAQDAIAWMRGVVGAAVTGVGINVGITSAVTTFAVASTGTAISTLSGAAATNATLAFLGGGSLAAGGGGMAVGAVALNFVTIGPALLVSGLVVAGQGEKAKTKASENEATVNVAIADMQATRAKFDAIVARAGELAGLLEQLVLRATTAFAQLDSEPFDPSRHAARFSRALTLAVAVRDVATTPIVDETGDLNEETRTFRIKYRTLVKESDHA